MFRSLRDEELKRNSALARTCGRTLSHGFGKFSKAPSAAVVGELRLCSNGDSSLKSNQQGWTAPESRYKMFHGFGVNHWKSKCGSIRLRSSMQVAVVRLELLEDRFLLAGYSASGLSDLGATPAVSPPTQQSNVSTGATSAGTQSGVCSAGAGSSTSDQQELPADFAPEMPAGGSAPGSVGPGASMSPACSAFCVATGASAAGGYGGSSSPGTGGVTTSQVPSITLPLPMPPGVPAGGIFKQFAVPSSTGPVGVLSLDPVAVDLSPLSTAPALTSGVAAISKGSQPTSLAAQASTTSIRFGVVQPSLISYSESASRTVPIVATVIPGRQRAELPDVFALAPLKAPERASVDTPGFADPTLSDGSITTPTTMTQWLVALARLSGVAGAAQPGEAETAESEREHTLIPANLAIYSAATLTIGVSAPGLTSGIRGGKWRHKQRSNVGPVRRY
jgi:hypothetical protein